MTFPDPAEENGIGVLFDEGEPEEILDLGAVDFLRPVPLEGIEGFNQWEARPSHQTVDTTALTGVCFLFDEALQELQVGPVFGGGLFGEGLVMLADKG